MSRARPFLPVVLLPLWIGCAQTPMVMSYFPDARESSASDRVWPAPPEIPRYRYAGQLVGESNFGPAEQSEPGAGERFLRWLVGLGQDRSIPRQLLPQAKAIEDPACPVGKGNRAVIVAGLGTRRRRNALDHGNAQALSRQGTGEAGTDHATAKNDYVMRFH